MYIHDECTFITVHKTDCLTPEEVIKEVTVKDFSKVSLEGFDTTDLDNLIQKVEVSS